MQAGIQLICSGIMVAYIIKAWPCARYIDNCSKVINELTFVVLISNAIYLKEMRQTVEDYTPSSNESAFSITNFLFIAVTSVNLIFHAIRLIHNSLLACCTIKLRR